MGAGAGASIVLASVGVKAAPRLAGVDIDALLARMTLDEKLGQLAQARGEKNDTGPFVPAGSEADVRAGRIGSFLSVYGAETTRRLQRIAVDETRLGIPLLFADDVIHGFRTIFPVPIAEAASFDPAAAEAAARIAAVEATANGLHWTYAPMVDMTRDPRWGRVVEGAGEDVELACRFAEARVRGFQGRRLSDFDAMLATAKHFVAYGDAEGGRDYDVADASARRLAEYYYPPFQAAIAAGVASIMVAFNEVNGVPMHANRDLLHDLLRRDWHFGGLIVSDYTGIRELIAHGVAATDEEAGILALKAGIDIDMVSSIYVDALPAAVRDGKVDVALVDAAVRRILSIKAALGLFDDPYRNCDPARAKRETLRPAHRVAARDLARKSLVLLQNEGDVLPLSKMLRSVAVVGPLADDRRSMLGPWAPTGVPGDAVTPLEGIGAALGAGAHVVHASGGEAALAAAREADAVILCIGENWDESGEARSRVALDLAPDQQALAAAILALGKPVATVIFAGRPLTINALAQHAPAILWAWYPGVEAGHALADILFGDVSPSGRLPMSFPRAVGQIPIHYDQRNTGRPASESERNTAKYVDAPWTPLYPFGHGLGYSPVAYEALELSATRLDRTDPLEVRFSVRNAGIRAVEEVVQLYLRDDVATTTRPVKALKRFARVPLEPGEIKQVRFVLGASDFALLDRNLRPVVEPGGFTLLVGGSSKTELEAKVTLEGAEERAV
ncbi:glycoside hydrolase family 3 N-terminal domain-containing protein [Sphingopyxis sp. JAI128]|uniref:glycoside hydrolase family 3 N-terminal domain-containing protein n=1 Tax=Sphingopyxis sp. JAI128 TaxID=2723066 RepID=UPI001615AF8B|nr:glycoside hydrolase family 3 N-terminal domain-containing protein [Sphingopyxis sp. JAI128]MBB6425321.1 beta-glucosidase [Sphingopyxis sp. JAI128]